MTIAEGTTLEEAIEQLAWLKHANVSRVDIEDCVAVRLILSEVERLKGEVAKLTGAYDSAYENCEAALADHAAAEARVKALEDALRAAKKVADEARVEWDNAPSGMKAGKLLIALSGYLPGYRKDIDEIHAALEPKP